MKKSIIMMLLLFAYSFAINGQINGVNFNEAVPFNSKACYGQLMYIDTSLLSYVYVYKQTPGGVDSAQNKFFDILRANNVPHNMIKTKKYTLVGINDLNDYENLSQSLQSQGSEVFMDVVVNENWLVALYLCNKYNCVYIIGNK